jgi:uncharacterized protein YkwD
VPRGAGPVVGDLAKKTSQPAAKRPCHASRSDGDHAGARVDSWPSPVARAAAENIRTKALATGKGKGYVAGSDIVGLRDDQWVTDFVIDAWLDLVQQFHDRNLDNMPRIHIMDTAFYTLMTVASDGSKVFDFPLIKRYFKDKDILCYDYIFFPVNQSQAHWTLVVINMNAKRIEYYDSSCQQSSVMRPSRKPTECCGQILRWLTEVLDQETEATQANIELNAWSTCAHQWAPQQVNGNDCGVYVCQFIKWLAARPRGTSDRRRGSSFPFSARDIAMLRVQMVHELSRGAIQPQHSTIEEIRRGRLELNWRAPRIGARRSQQAARDTAPPYQKIHPRRYRTGDTKADLIKVTCIPPDDTRALVTDTIKACFADKAVTVKITGGGSHRAAFVGFADAEKPHVNRHVEALRLRLTNLDHDWTVSPAPGTTKATELTLHDVYADTGTPEPSWPESQSDRDGRLQDAPPTAAQAAMAHHQQAGALAVDVYTAILRARSDPIAFAAFLEDRIQCYTGMHYYPRHGGPAQITTEGSTAVYEAIQFLRDLPRNRSVLRPDLSLHLAGADHCHDVGRTGHASHTGGDGSRHGTRQERYVAGATNTGECIWLGPVRQHTTGMDIVAEWVIDDGVGSRSHRTCMFDSVYTSVGIASGTHSSMGSIVVMELAAGHTSRTAHTASRLTAGPPDVMELPDVRKDVPRTRWNLGLCQYCELPIEGGAVSQTTMPDGTIHRHHMQCLATGEPPPNAYVHGMAPSVSTLHGGGPAEQYPAHPQFHRVYASDSSPSQQFDTHASQVEDAFADTDEDEQLAATMLLYLDGDGFPSATEQAMYYKIPWEQLPSATQDTLESLIWRGCCWPGPCPGASGSICPTTGKMESSPAPAWSSDSDKEDDPGNPPREY